MTQHAAPARFTPKLVTVLREGYGDGTVPVTATHDLSVVTVRISGAFFFGSAGVVAAALDRIAARPRAYVLDMSELRALDSTAAAAIRVFAEQARGAGAPLYVAGATQAVRRTLLAQGLRSPLMRFGFGVRAAHAAAHAKLAQVPLASGPLPA